MNFTYSDYLGLTLVFYFPIYMKQWPKPLEGSGIFSTHLVLLSLLIIKNFVPQPNKEDGWKKTSYTNLKNTSSCVTHVTIVATSSPSPLPNAVAVNVWSTWVHIFQLGGRGFSSTWMWASKLLTLAMKAFCCFCFWKGNFVLSHKFEMSSRS